MTENLLGNETSPYLLQHKDNPVNWRPWGEAALAEARDSNKPILLSIGYAACHWCHVMAHESFEDDGVAAVMNDGFVNIKVDREERPDIDSIYMSALQMLGEQGGWPLTMFLTPAGEPFWGGTYFPREPRFGRPGFIDLLNEVSRIFEEEPEKVEQNRAALLERLQAMSAPASPDAMSPDLPGAAAERLLTVMDPVNGGLQGAPKFPQTGVLELIWRAGERSGDAKFSEAAAFALARMCQGGIYDHLGGGFARYTVDARWLVPHFEKMLYDNALILDLLVHGWQATRNQLFAARIEETIAWLTREMSDRGGGFASSLDADSEGEEGKFYVWSAEEIRQALGDDDFALFAEVYDVAAAGNWEGKTILNRLGDAGLRDPDTESRLAAMRATLLDKRGARVRPGLDDKVLADWNGLMIHALARAGFAFAREDWIALAARAFGFVAESMMEQGRLLHSYRAGKAAQKGMLSDYANMIRAALALYEITAEGAYLAQAKAWSEVLGRHFLAPDGAYYMTADDASDLIVRPRSGIDDATPNGNAVSAANHLRLWHLTGESRHRERAEAIFAAHAADIRRNVFGFATMLNAYDFALRPVELVIATPEDGSADALLDAARSLAAFNLMVSQTGPGKSVPESHPAHGKGPVDGRAAAYVCTQQGCSLPVTEPGALLDAVAAAAARGG